MAGQIYSTGNAYQGYAEFNWWFDPEATQIVLRADVPHYIIPLDCTNTVPLAESVFDQIANHQPQTIITQLFSDEYASSIESNSPPSVYDTIALAYLCIRSLQRIHEAYRSI